MAYRRFLAWVFAVLTLAAAAGTPEVVLQMGNREALSAVAVSPDQRFVLTGDMGGGLVLWSFPSGRQIRTLEGHTRILGTVAFSPDGKRALSGSWDHTMRLWDLATGACLRTFAHAGMVEKVVYLPNGRQALSAGDDATVKLWDLATGAKVRTFTGHAKNLTCVAVSGDGRVAVSGGIDQTLKLWSVASGLCLRTFKGHTDAVSTVAMAPDGRTFASYADDGTVRFWLAATGREARSMPLKDVETLAYSPDGQRLLTTRREPGGTNWHVLEVWEAATGRMLNTLRTKAGAAAFLPGGRQALSGTPRSYYGAGLWDLDTGQELRAFEGKTDLICGVAASALGSPLLSGSTGNGLLLWDVEGGALARVLRGHTDHVKAVALAQDGQHAFTASGDPFSGLNDFSLKYWDLASGKELNGFKPQAGMLAAVALSPDGKYALSAASYGDNTVRLWDVTRRDEVRVFQGHAQPVNSVAFTPDGAHVLSGSADKTMKLWDAATGQVERTFRGHTGSVTAAVAPDGRFAVSGSSDHTVRIWNLATGETVHILSGHTASVLCVRYSPDGRQILSGGMDSLVILWDAATGLELRRFKGHQGDVNAVAFAPDGQRAYSSSRDGTVRVWDLVKGGEVAMLVDFTDGEWIVLTPGGYFNASPGGARHVNVRVGAEVYGVDQLYARFFRPELVRLALAGRAVAPAESFGALLAARPAPRVRILAPASGLTLAGDTVTVKLGLTDAGGGLGGVNLYLNGAQVSNEARGIQVKGLGTETTLTFSVPLVDGPNEIRAVAFNRDRSVESAPAVVSVVSGAARRKPDLHVLAVGINDYRNTSITLTNAAADAAAFAGTLRQVGAPLFGTLDIQVLTRPADTAKAALVEAFGAMAARIRPNDVFVFYDASHGVVDVVDGEERSFLLTSDALLLSSRHIGEGALSQKELARLVGAMPAQKKLVVLDTCQAGKGGKDLQAALLQQTRGLTEATAVKLLQRAIGSAVFAASSDTQAALEGYRGHGLFTFVLLEGLKGGADFKKDGYITVLGLADYVEGEVTRLSEEVFKRQQTPTIETGANFPIGRVR